MKIEENAEGDEYGGITAVTDIGRWREKKEAIWTSMKNKSLDQLKGFMKRSKLTMRMKMLRSGNTRKTRQCAIWDLLSGL